MRLINKSAPFDLLKVLIAVAESRNFREAADKLQLSQPGVSVKLRELEAYQPLPLFNIEGKRKVLTHFGRSLYEVAKEEAIRLDRKIEDIHRVYSSTKLLTLRIAGRNEVLEYIAPLLDFEGKVELFNCSSKEAVDRMLRHGVDIAISYVQPDSTEIQAKKLFSSKVSFAVDRSWLGKQKLTLDLIKSREFLVETPCISYLKDGHLISDWVKHHEVPFHELNVKFVAEDWRTVERLVDQGIGYAIIPSYVQSHSPNVERLELADNVLKPLSFYAMFEKNLKKIEAFKKVLSFSKFNS